MEGLIDAGRRAGAVPHAGRHPHEALPAGQALPGAAVSVRVLRADAADLGRVRDEDGLVLAQGDAARGGMELPHLLREEGQRSAQAPAAHVGVLVVREQELGGLLEEVPGSLPRCTPLLLSTLH